MKAAVHVLCAAAFGMIALLGGCSKEDAPEAGRGTMVHQSGTDQGSAAAPAQHQHEHAAHQGAVAASAGQADARAGKTEVAQKLCPIMEMPINKNVYADYAGRRIYFCCDECPARFQKGPDAYLAKVDAELAAAQ